MSQKKPIAQRLHPRRWLVAFSTLLCVLLLVSGIVSAVWAQEFAFLPLLFQGQNPATQATIAPAAASDEAIQLVAGVPEVAEWLAQHPGWVAESYQSDSNPQIWYVYFFLNLGQENQEWLGEGAADLASKTVLSYFVPRELTPEEFAFGLQKIQTYLKYDPEIAARFGNSSAWERIIQYNRWRGVWEAIYTRQPVTTPTTRFIATLVIDADTKRVYLEQIQDAQTIAARDVAESERNQAIQLTWQADGVGEAVSGHDNVEAYVEPTALDGRYTVTFRDNAVPLFWALVDVHQAQVIEAGR